jgi:molybdenum cofactor cytidylyltransferase
MVDGIILAGGYSKRLGRNKMSILFKNKPVIQHTIEHMQSVCHHIYVVTGFYHEEIMKILDKIDNVQVVFNAEYEKGMFSSVQCGVACTNHDFFIIPGDYPMVQKKVYQQILLGTKGIRVPSFSFKLGHPIYLKKTYKEALLETKHTNLKSFRNAYDYEIIEVDDDGILFDIDTIEDFNQLKEKE